MTRDDAVEAGLRAWGARGGLSPEAIVRNVLEAAAPHMLAGVTALADDWEKQGEYDMAYSKTVADQDIAIQLLQAGAQMVDDARLVRNAIGATTEDAAHGND